jgi:protease I
MAKLDGRKIAVLVADGVEESELQEPMRALRDEGAEVVIASPSGKAVQQMQHDEKTSKVDVQMRTLDLTTRDFDGVVLPGGAMNADHLRMDEDAQRFIRAMDADGKPIAAICHAPWLLVSARLVPNRTLTSYYTLKDDIRNAGGTWVDTETNVDGNLLTSRNPGDIPAFNEKMIEMFAAVSTAMR